MILNDESAKMYESKTLFLNFLVLSYKDIKVLVQTPHKLPPILRGKNKGFEFGLHTFLKAHSLRYPNHIQCQVICLLITSICESDIGNYSSYDP